MKLAVSNIAWNSEENTAVFDILRRHGVSGIEVAPTKFWPGWIGATTQSANNARLEYSNLGFEIPALQAVLFDRPELKVFDDPAGQAAILDHIDDVAQLGAKLGARVLVFGSPRNRDPGNRTQEQAHSEAVDFFLRAAKLCNEHSVQLCLEPNPSVYGCRFMTHWQEVQAVVDDVGHDGLGIHLDTACIFLSGDDVVEAVHACAGRICHFHISEPELSDFSNPAIDHAAIGGALRDIGYDGWLSIEMRRSDDPLNSIDNTLAQVRGWYGLEDRYA